MELPSPCVNGPYVWLFVVLAILSHARGVALLLREVASWAKSKRVRDRSTQHKKPPTPGV